LDTQYVAPYQSNIIEAVATLLDVTSEDSLILILETLEFAIKVSNPIILYKIQLTFISFFR